MEPHSKTRAGDLVTNHAPNGGRTEWKLVDSHNKGLFRDRQLLIFSGVLLSSRREETPLP
eukprot:242154-Amphidinium_carterae.2